MAGEGQDRLQQAGTLMRGAAVASVSVSLFLVAIKTYAYKPHERALAGQDAHEQAKERSAIRLVDRYLKVYQQIAQLSMQALY